MLVANHKTYKQPPLEIYLDELYNGHLFGDEVIGTSGVVGKRKTVTLTQDAVFKNQFYNEELNLVVRPRNELSEVKLYDENGDLLPFVNYTVSPEYCSIIFEGEPKVKPVKVEACFYIGKTENSLMLNDGSTQMVDDYTPIKDKDVVTKDYVEKLVGNKASMFPIEFEVTQDDKALKELIYYADNRKYPVIIAYSGSKVKVVTNDFVIDNTMDQPYISLKFGDIELFKENLNVVCAGTSKYWKLLRSRNIEQDENIRKIFYKNAYELEFDAGVLIPYQEIIKQDVLTLQVSTYNSKLVSSMPFGVDKFVDLDNITIEPVVRDIDLEALRTHWVSGINYTEPDMEPTEVPIKITVKAPYHFFRPEKVGIVSTYCIEEDISSEPKELILNSHVVDEDIVFETTCKVWPTINQVDTLIYNTYYIGKCRPIFIDLSSSSDNEDERMFGPDPYTLSPRVDQLRPWNSKEAIHDYDMIKKDGVYTHPNGGMLYVKVEGKDFSHLELDAEYDGEVFVKVAGETGWLATTSYVSPFVIPKIDFEQCKLKEEDSTRIFTFGKVVYSGTVFLRFMDCNIVKINSMKLL